MDKTLSLEKKLEIGDWKQWIPVYGIHKAYKNLIDGKPSVIDTPSNLCGVLVSTGYEFYQGISPIVVGALMYDLYFVYHITKKLFE